MFKINELDEKLRNRNYVFDQNLNNMILLKQTINEFWQLTKLQRCAYCDASAAKFKKQGFIKLFQQPMSQKEKKKMKKKGINPEKDALEEGSGKIEQIKENKKKLKKNKKHQNGLGSDIIMTEDKDNADSDSQSEIEETELVKNDHSLKYLHPLEIKEHIKRLWENDGDLLSVIFGNLEIFNNKNDSNEDFSENFDQIIKQKYNFNVSSSGSNIFFIETMIVPPNRFRPENNSDESTYLNQQSSNFVRVINLSNQLRELSLRLGKSEETKEENTADIDNKDKNNQNKKKKKDQQNLESISKKDNEKKVEINDIIAKSTDCKILLILFLIRLRQVTRKTEIKIKELDNYLKKSKDY